MPVKLPVLPALLIVFIFAFSLSVSAQTTLMTYTGAHANDRFSWECQSVGDVNGDGYLDFAIGAAYANSYAGAISVYLGGPSIPAAASYMINGSSNSYAGFTLGAGDVNNDNFSDIIIGDVNSGKVLVYFGASTPHNSPDITLNAPINSTLYGYKVYSKDVNGDGISDILASALDYPDGASHTGCVYIYYGGASIHSTPDVTLSGVAGSFFGSDVVAGDFNHDGKEDLAVAGYLYNSYMGFVNIFYGSVSGFNATPDVVLTGEATNDNFGRSITVLDINGDGFSDLAVGAPFANSRTGRVYVYYGSNTHITATPGLTISYPNEGGWDELFGMKVANAGDVNTDGFDDLLAGSQNALNQRGKAFVYYGGSTPNGTIDLTMQGDADFSFMGEFLAGIGDINHNGKPKFIAGGTYYGSWSGRVKMFEDPSAAVVSVSLTAPNGGQNWMGGTSHNITWTSTGVTNVRLEFSSDNGTTWTDIVASVAASSGSYAWTLPNIESSNCKVRVSNTANAGTNSVSAAVFSIYPNPNPHIPVLTYPSNWITIYTNSPAISWYMSSFAEGLTFNLQLSQDSLFVTGVTNDTGITINSFLVSGLTPGARYYSRVRSLTTTGHYSDWSSTGAFTVYSQGGSNLPAMPTFSYPNNGATIWATSFNLNWFVGSPLNGETYHLQVSLLRNLSSPFIDVQNISTQYYGVSGLTPGATYYMRVRSKLPSGTYSSFTAIDSFVVSGSSAGSPVIPVFSYPTGGVTVYTASPSINWYLTSAASAQDYQLQVATDNAFAGLIVDQSNITQTTYGLSGLSLGTTYYTRVRSRLLSNGSYSAWSNTGDFTVSANSYAVIPRPGNPVNGIVIPMSSPQLSWFLPAASNVLSYKVEYASTVNNIIVSQSGIVNQSLSISGLTANTAYKWRVFAQNTDGSYTQPSNWAEFTTGTLTSVGLNKLSPGGFVVDQNYPNPFNPSTTISFSIPEQARVIVSIYNQLGEKLLEVANGTFSAGYNSVNWDAKDLTSGIYFCEVKTEKYSSIKKLILLK